MNEKKCPQCGASVSMTDSECKYCGEKFAAAPQPQYQQQYQQPQYQQQPQQVVVQQVVQPQYTAINPAWPIKSKVVAGILGIFLGGLGVHKFYLGKVGMGILYLLFCWTSIPAWIGFIEGIIYLCSNDENFQLKNQVRLQ